VSEPIFLSLAEVVEIHNELVEKFGGSHGVRDMGLLESAVSMPQASFGGKYLHATLFEMAAAYAFHIAENQPFVDGNKRAALASALTFLEMNGISLKDLRNRLYKAMMNVGKGQMTKKELADVFRELAKR